MTSIADAPLTSLDSTLSTAVVSYVIDTSVLLSDPHALFRFAEHEVVLPLSVIAELEGKRHHPELGYAARRALGLLDDLRADFGTLAEPVPIGETGGTLRIVLASGDITALPPGIDRGSSDGRILGVALAESRLGREVVVVTKDAPLRITASALGLAAEEYLAEQAVDSGYTGLAQIEIAEGEMQELFERGHLSTSGVDGLLVHQGLVMQSSRGSALGRITGPGQLRLVRGDTELFGLHGRSAEQRIAIELLRDPEIGIVSLGGRAGTGKSALALLAGLEAVLEQRSQKKIMVFRPLYAVGGQDLGFLPGSEGDKMNPWAEAVFDTLGSLVSKNVLDEVADRGLLEVLPLTHIRGRSLHDAFVIVDEAQSLERNVLLTVLSRLGQNARVVLTHDVAQRDNLRVGRHDGVAAVIEKLKGHELFAHVTLTRSERSAVAALVTSVLEEYDEI